MTGRNAVRRLVKLLASAMFVLAHAGAVAQVPETAVGVVNGELISQAQLLEAVAALRPPQPSGAPLTDRERLEAMHKALDAIAEEKMIAAEAASQQVTPR